MLVSEAFKKDTLSKNTQIVPLVVIEKFVSQEPSFSWEDIPAVYQYEFLSTNNIEVDGNYFKPLLLQIPSIKQKVNLDTGKYQTSSVTLKISNMEYNNSPRLSESFDVLTNLVVSIYYKSQSCTTVQMPDGGSNGIPKAELDTTNGCPIAFSGYITKVSHNADEITLTIEDVSDKKINKNLPIARLGSTNNIPDKYKNSYYPMLYGKLENAPSIAMYEGDRFTLKSDYLNIATQDKQMSDYAQGFGQRRFGAVNVFNEQYSGCTKYANLYFETSGELDDMDYPIEFQGQSRQQYKINEDGSVSFLSNSMFNQVNRVEALFHGSPKNIVLKKNNSLIISSEGSFASGVQFIQEQGEDQYIETDEYRAISDKDYTTSINENHSSQYSFTNEGGGTNSHASNLTCLFSLQWDSGLSGAKYYKIVQNRINNIRIPTKGDAHYPSGLGYWDFDENYYFVGNTFDYLQINGGYGLQYGGHLSLLNTGRYQLESLISFSVDGDADTWQSAVTGNTYNIYYNPNAYFQFERNLSLDTNANGSLYNSIHNLPLIRFAHSDNALPSCGDGWSSMEFFTHDLTLGGQNNTFNSHAGGDITANIDLDIQEIEVMSIVNFDDVVEKNYYLNSEGRADEFLKNYQHTFINSDGESQNFTYTPSDYLINPADIVRHILVEECKIPNTSFDEDEFNEAWMACHGSIRHDYSVNKKINSLDLFSEISKSSMITPRIKSDGKIGFITTNKYYHYERDYIPARQIELDDIISYKLMLTPSNDIVSKLDVSYGYDYEQDKTLKTTDEILMSDSELFNLKIDVEDKYKNLDTKYIQDESSAIAFRNLKFHDKKSQHLQIELRLPLSYIDLETGDLVKIQELIDGIKAYGIDYTKTEFHLETLKYPIFQVIDIAKNIDFVTIKLHQLHALESYSNIAASGHLNNWYSGLGVDDADEDLPDDAIDFDTVEQFGFTSTSGFFIGANSEFSLGDHTFPSSYSRKIMFTEGYLGTDFVETLPSHWQILTYGLHERINLLFGYERFGLSSWDALIPEANSDGSGYGILTNGDTIKNFVALEIRLHNVEGYVGEEYILQLRNIKGSAFDDEYFDPEATLIEYPINSSEQEIKLGWVLSRAVNETIAGLPYAAFGAVALNLQLGMFPSSYYLWAGSDLNSLIFSHEFVLYPHINPLPDLELEYTAATLGNDLVDMQIEIPPNPFGDVNLDGLLNVMDVVMLVNQVLGSGDVLTDEQFNNADVNNDGMLDILDVVFAVSVILGNSEIP